MNILKKLFGTAQTIEDIVETDNTKWVTVEQAAKLFDVPLNVYRNAIKRSYGTKHHPKLDIEFKHALATALTTQLGEKKAIALILSEGIAVDIDLEVLECLV